MRETVQYLSVMIEVRAARTQPRKPDGELAQPRVLELPIVDGVVDRRGMGVLLGILEEEVPFAVVLENGTEADSMLIEVMVLFMGMLLEGGAGQSVGTTMRLTFWQPDGTSAPLLS